MTSIALLRLADRYLDRLQQNAKIQVNIINGNVTRLSLQDSPDQEETARCGGRFPQNSNWRQGQDLFDLLLAGHFIDATTDIDNWMWTMGYSPQKPQQLQPIKWLKTKAQLRVMLDGVLTALAPDNAMKVTDMERLVPQCFVNKDGNPLYLSKPKAEFSEEMDQLKDFFDSGKTRK